MYNKVLLRLLYTDNNDDLVVLIMQADLVAGLTVGVMAVPQVVSFAAMAGVPAAFGLYGCFAPVIAYSLFGGSPHLVSSLSSSRSYMHHCKA